MKPKNGVWEETTTERGKFARLCVEVDWKKPLISQFELLGRDYSVEYEGLFLICFTCGKYGHRKEGCPLVEKQVNTSNGTPMEVGAEEAKEIILEPSERCKKSVDETQAQFQGKQNPQAPKSVLNMKKVARNQGTTNTVSVDNCSQDSQGPSHKLIPIVQPMIIPKALVCSPEQPLPGGICNSSPPDISGSLVLFPSNSPKILASQIKNSSNEDNPDMDYEGSLGNVPIKPC
ncbi:Zinc finger, CCHC-type [Sesbania bispinosa]|nr:Zinc finger, CCHC-type [Sesbania bispinosa]